MLAKHRTTEGKPGLLGEEVLSGQAFEAFAVIDDARAARLKEELDAR